MSLSQVYSGLVPPSAAPPGVPTPTAAPGSIGNHFAPPQNAALDAMNPAAPMPPANVPSRIPTGSPIHDYVSQQIAAGNSVTPASLVSMSAHLPTHIALSSMEAQGIINDVVAQRRGPQIPPQGSVAQPVAGAALAPPTGNAAPSPLVMRPNALPPTLNAPPAAPPQQGSIQQPVAGVNLPPPPVANGSPLVMAQGANVPPPQAPPAGLATSPFIQNLANVPPPGTVAPPVNIPMGSIQNPLVTPNAPGLQVPLGNIQSPVAAPNIPPPNEPSRTAPGAQPDETPITQAAVKGSGFGNKLADFAGKAIPLALLLAAGRNNPAAAASLLEGYQSGKANQSAQQERAAATKAAADQQAKENDFKQQGLTQDQEKIEQNDPTKIAGVNAKNLTTLQGQPDAEHAHDEFARQLAQNGQAMSPEQEAFFHDPNDPTKWLDHNPYVKPETAYQTGELGQHGATLDNTEANQNSGRRSKLMTYLAGEPDTQKQDAAIKNYNDNAVDSTGKRLDYVKMPGEDGTKSYYDPTGKTTATVAGINARTDQSEAQTQHTKVETANIPLALQVRQGALRVSQGSLALAQQKWAQNVDNPTSIYYGAPKPTTPAQAEKTWDFLTDKAQQSSKASANISQQIDKARAAFTSDHLNFTRGAVVNGTKVDPQPESAWPTSAWAVRDQQTLDDLTKQVGVQNQTTTNFNNELADLAKTVAPNRTGRSAAGAPLPNITTPSPTGAQIAKQATTNPDLKAVCTAGGDCQKFVRLTTQAVTPTYNQYWGKTAKITMNNFQNAGVGRAYQVGDPLAPGDLIYSGRMGGASGHAAIVGPDGRVAGTFGMPKDKIDWVVPIGSGGNAQVAKAPVKGPKLDFSKFTAN